MNDGEQLGSLFLVTIENWQIVDLGNKGTTLPDFFFFFPFLDIPDTPFLCRLRQFFKLLDFTNTIEPAFCTFSVSL